MSSDTGASGASRSSSRLHLSSHEQAVIAAILLCAATLLTYAPVKHAGFLTYDDPEYVLQNPLVNRGITAHAIAHSFTDFQAANWHPITWLSHMVDVQLFGFRPAGHHLDSLLWHLANVLLLFFLLRVATGRIWRSATLAALFALCPLNVQCVAWISERKSLICTTFLLLALFAYGRYAQRRSVGRYLLALLLFAFGLMAKAMIVTLPALLLLADYWPLKRIDFSRPYEEAFGRRFWTLALEKVPFLIFSVAASVITVFAQKSGGAIASTALVPVRYRLANAAYSYVLYLAKMFWPSGLEPFHPHPGASLNKALAAAAGLALALITAAVWHWRRNGPLLVGWFWYLIALFPAIGILQVGRQGWAERYAYIPFMGIFLALVWLGAHWARRINLSPAILVLAALGPLAAYGWISHTQCGFWQNTLSLFSHAQRIDPNNGVSEASLGMANWQAGQLQTAEREFRAAIAFMPDVLTFRYDLGMVLRDEGRSDEAIRVYRDSFKVANSAEAHINLASIYLGRNDLDGALAEYTAAIKSDRDNPFAYAGRGAIELRRRQLDAALADVGTAAKLAPNPDLYTLLGHVYLARGDRDQAAAWYEKALRLDPGFKNAAAALAAVRSGASISISPKP